MGISQEKAKGRFYTPGHIVRNILDLSGYAGSTVLRKHVIDNSCGDGAFLTAIIERYCAAAQEAHYSGQRLAEELGTFIHGIEIDADERNKAAARAAETARRYGAGDIDWDINRGDALTERRYDGKMDFVLGNPPYVRVHNLADTYEVIKRFRFTRAGMTDLFLVFYEIGLAMLKPGGTLGYITPSSLFNSKAAAELRRHLIEKNLIRTVADLKHYQPFKATTYTTILILRKEENRGREEPVNYRQYDAARGKTHLVSRLNSGDFWIGGNFYFGTKPTLARLAEVLACNTHLSGPDVKNGFATLCDSFFIGDFPFSEFVIPTVKASTGKRTMCLFPYDRNGKPIPFSEIEKNKAVLAYYLENETRLRKRSLAEQTPWHLFGRTQGIRDVYKRKYSVCPIIREAKDLKLTLCDCGTGVYGGLYILTDLDERTITEALPADEFMEYVTLLGKYKSGGYYTFSSADLQRYLAYKLSRPRLN